jgi:hypothetical protein
MISARRLLAGAAVAASAFTPELSAQDPFWIQAFQAPPSEVQEFLASIQFAAIYGSGIRFDLFALPLGFGQFPGSQLTAPSLWTQTVGTLNGQLFSLPIGLEFAPGTFLGLGLTLPSDLTGVDLHSHDLCDLTCEVDPATLPFVILRARAPDGLYHTFGPQQLVAFSATWEESTTVTPEPGTLLLVASGFLGVVAVGRLKRPRELATESDARSTA